MTSPATRLLTLWLYIKSRLGFPNEPDDFLSKNHHHLLNIAAAANIFSWIFLVFALVYAGLNLFNSETYCMEYFFQPQLMDKCTIFSALRHDPFSFLKTALGILVTVFHQLVRFFLLKGVALGLNMIVETDLTYREQHWEESNG